MRRRAEQRPPPGLANTVAVFIDPSSVSLPPGGTQSFSSLVSGLSNTAVLWSITEGAAGGTIDDSGNYTAPATLGTYHVVVTSAVNQNKTATAIVTVTNDDGGTTSTSTDDGGTTTTASVQVSINPTTASVPAGLTQPFTATVTGSTNLAVTWSVQEAMGGVLWTPLACTPRSYDDGYLPRGRDQRGGCNPERHRDRDGHACSRPWSDRHASDSLCDGGFTESGSGRSLLQSKHRGLFPKQHRLFHV